MAGVSLVLISNMDRDVYVSFSDVLRWHSFLILVSIRATYRGVVSFHFDVSDAFQSTRTDTGSDNGGVSDAHLGRALELPETCMF